ncbi:MAG: phosphoribosylglycinamide formyltransferase [Syntrophales bacterium LBB04]|nr:phosphoribosylglycinamide formyltransferase [Syntrophales bacterium LBB04]
MAKIVDLGILVSGSGSNLQSIIDRIEDHRLAACIQVVISNNPEAYALQRIKKYGIPAAVIDHREFGSREAFDQRMIEVLRDHHVELVAMAGFMRVLTPVFLNAFPMRIMNIHPALLPSFQGTHAQKRAFEYGVKFSGCTVHFADEGVDTGPIIIQALVPILDDDTEETLADRILREEHRIYPQAIQFYAEGRIELVGRKIRIRGAESIAGGSLHNPPLSGF